MEHQKIAFPEYTEECPEGVYELITDVNETQTDSNGIMRPGDLVRQIQVMVEKHLDRYSGTTVKALQDAALSWIIVWNELTIQRLPKAGEQICMRVWAGKKQLVMHTRKCAIYTMDGEPLVSMAALFILMDQKTRKMADDPPELEQQKIVKIPGEPKPPKMMMPFPEEFSDEIERTVQPEEIDKYGHMNNSHYLDWMDELRENTDLKGRNPQKIWIEYTKEMLEGYRVQLQYTVSENTLYLVGSSQGEQRFLIKAEYR